MNFSEILDRPIAFQRPFVALGAGITGALMLSQAVYWARRGSNEQGWFFKTQVEWEEETGLGRAEQETARKRLVSLEVLEEDRKGIPAKLFYRVNFEKLEARLLAFCTRNQDCGNPAIKDAGNQQTGLRESDTPDCGNPANRPAGMSQSKLRKTTTETTTETTSDIDVTPPRKRAKVTPKKASAPKKPAKPANTDDGSEPSAPRPPMLIPAANGIVHEIPGDLHYPGEGTKTHKAWIAYAIAYHGRYHSWPVWNGTVGGQISNFIERVGMERAPRIAVHFVRRVHEEFVVKLMHPVKLLLSDAEKWATQCDTGRTVTSEGARQMDRTASNAITAEDAGEKAIAMVAARRARAAAAAGTEGGNDVG